MHGGHIMQRVARDLQMLSMEMKRSTEFGRGPHGLREVFAPRIRGRRSNLIHTVEPFC